MKILPCPLFKYASSFPGKPLNSLRLQGTSRCISLLRGPMFSSRCMWTGSVRLGNLPS